MQSSRTREDEVLLQLGPFSKLELKNDTQCTSVNFPEFIGECGDQSSREGQTGRYLQGLCYSYESKLLHPQSKIELKDFLQQWAQFYDSLVYTLTVDAVLAMTTFPLAILGKELLHWTVLTIWRKARVCSKCTVVTVQKIALMMGKSVGKPSTTEQLNSDIYQLEASRS